MLIFHCAYEKEIKRKPLQIHEFRCDGIIKMNLWISMRTHTKYFVGLFQKYVFEPRFCMQYKIPTNILYKRNTELHLAVALL